MPPKPAIQVVRHAKAPAEWKPPAGWSDSFALDGVVASIEDLLAVLEQILENNIVQDPSQFARCGSSSRMGVIRDVWCLLRQLAKKYLWDDLPKMPEPEIIKLDQMYSTKVLRPDNAIAALETLELYLLTKQKAPEKNLQEAEGRRSLPAWATEILWGRLTGLEKRVVAYLRTQRKPCGCKEIAKALDLQEENGTLRNTLTQLVKRIALERGGGGYAFTPEFKAYWKEHPAVENASTK